MSTYRDRVYVQAHDLYHPDSPELARARENALHSHQHPTAWERIRREVHPITDRPSEVA